MQGNRLRFKTGFSSIDSCFPTWGPELALVAGRPGMGMLDFCLNILAKMDAGARGWVLSLNPRAMDHQKRLKQMVPQIPLIQSDILKSHGFSLNDHITDPELHTYHRLAKNSLSELEKLIREAARSGTADLIILDSLEYIEDYEAYLFDPGALYQEFFYFLDDWADELNIPIILSCKVNKAIEEHPHLTYKRLAKMDPLRFKTIFLHRYSYYEQGTDEYGMVVGPDHVRIHCWDGVDKINELSFNVDLRSGLFEEP